ncbi:XdhC family protein, partial [Thermodesulfobacteriota bacterium]
MNRFSVLATLISRSGSAPRSAGTKFLVLEDGSSVGTIGGGVLEMSV